MKSNFINNLPRTLFLFSIGFVTLFTFQNCSPGGFKVDDEAFELASVGGTSATNSVRFAAAKAVLDNRCNSCHTGQADIANLNFDNEAAFISAGLINPGVMATSKLIYRLHNYPEKDGAQNMPPTGPLTTEEYNTLADWVSNIPSQALACTSETQLLAPQIKRLTQSQFRNSITNVFGGTYADNMFPNFGDANPEIGLANDPDILRINEVNVQSLYDSTKLIVNAILNQNTTVRNCVSSTVNTCYQTLVQDFGLRLWRRPLTTTEVADVLAGQPAITNGGGTRAQVVDHLLTSLIMSPNHLFRTEIGSVAANNLAAFNLTHYEIASLLSFSIWDGPPDATLLDLAQSGQLQNVAVLRGQVTRMVEDSRFQRKMTSFIVDLLKLESVRTVFKDSSFGLTAADRQALLSSATNTLDGIFATPTAPLLAPFSTRSFHVNNQTARFFNLNPAGYGANMSLQNVDPNQRYGILSHPAFLTTISGELGSGIVKRGVFALEQLLCNHLGTPPAGIGSINLPDVINPDLMSTRELLRISHSGQMACIGCHSKIDPAGFGFENFDAIGLFRTTEKQNVPIDASGTLVGATDQPLVFTNSVTYLQAISQSSNFRSCVTKKYFKFASGQSPDSINGQCELRNFEANMSQKPDTTASLVQSLVELRSFIMRRPASQQ